MLSNQCYLLKAVVLSLLQSKAVDTRPRVVYVQVHVTVAQLPNPEELL
jgi:hypothetical protein